MTDWRPIAASVPFVAASGALVVWLASDDGLVERDDPLPKLPIRTLDGKDLLPEHFDGRAWVINVWLPG